ncbi:MAG: low molecular weight phosphotyrosine protein phosphatase [Bacteroidetes bacterium]|nr:low molecular weight phosphotyrosine protein phosphatase [Bacteroidota bacterium]
MRILMVCLGNICRSPLADGVLRQKVEQRGLLWEVDSAGTANYHIGEPPDERMIKTAQGRGVDISWLRARQFSQQDFKGFDRIYVMDRSNRSNVLKLTNEEDDRQKVYLLLDHLYPGEAAEVPDPYYGNSEDFDRVYTLIDEATNALIKDLSYEP